MEGTDRIAGSARLDRVAVIAHWAAEPRLDRSTLELLRALLGHGYETLLVSTAPRPGTLEMPAEMAASLTVLRRPNLGYDFGSWATALDRYPAIADAEHVLLLNSSLVGPFAPIDTLLRHFENTPADVWGITDSTQFGRHVQSYCIGFRGRSLTERPIAAFWRGIRVEADRAAVIERGELALGSLLRRERYVVDVAIPSWRIVPDGKNPTIIGWRSLLDHGFPFVKRQLLREPGVAPDGAQVPGELRQRFGIEVSGWM